MKNRWISYILIMTILVTGIVPSYVGVAADATSQKVRLIEKVKTVKQEIKRGQKDVIWEVSKLEAKISNDYEINEKYKDDNIKRHIKFLINGEEDLHLNREVDMTYKNNILSIKTRDNSDYLLREGGHYSIFIPRDYFLSKKDARPLDRDLYYNFLTRVDSIEAVDTAYLNLPAGVGSSIDAEKGLIFIKFLDEIHLRPGIEKSIDQYIEIESRFLEDAKTDKWKTVKEDMGNFEIRVGGGSKKDTLIIEKPGGLSLLAEYRVKLDGNIVSLGQSANEKLDIGAIYNEELEIEFTEPELVKHVGYSTDADNIPNYMEIEFKMPIKLSDKTEIKLKSKDNVYISNLDKNVKLDGKNKLMVDLRDYKDKIEKNKIYTLILGKGALKLEENGESYHNNDFKIYFITGSANPIYPGGPGGGSGTGSGPGSEGGEGDIGAGIWSVLSTNNYSSDLKLENDILDRKTSQLGEDGNIYIGLESDIGLASNKGIFWDKQVDGDSKKILDSFELYEISRKIGKNYPNNVIYMKDKKEIPIKRISILNDDTLKIEPMNKLLAMNEYEIVLRDRTILRDSYGGRLTKRDPLVLGQRFWTKKGNRAEEVIDWSEYDLAAGDENVVFSKNPDGSMNAEIKVVPDYDPSGKREEEPIRLNIRGKKLILNPEIENPYEGIHLTNLESKKEEKIKLVEIEYIKVDGIEYSQISIYPENKLEIDVEYQLKIDEGILIDRSEGRLDDLTLKLGLKETNANISPILKVKTDKEEIKRGQKEVEWTIRDLEVQIDSNFKVNPKYEKDDIRKHVKIYANGVDETDFEVDSKGNKKYRKIEFKNNRIKLRVEETPNFLGDKQPFVLRAGTHYRIVLPKDYFIHRKNGEVIRKDVHFNFLTRGDEARTQDLAYLNLLDGKSSYLLVEEGQIVIKFIEDISFNQEFLNKLEKFFSVEYKLLLDGSSDKWRTIKEDMKNYSISIEGDKLILQKLDKDGKKTSLNPLGKYRVEIGEGIVYLESTKSNSNKNIEQVFNGDIELVFKTGSAEKEVIDWIDWSTSKDNVPNNIPINPFIHIHFKNKIRLLDAEKIHLSSDAGIYTLDVKKNIWVSEDGKTLYININDLDRTLRKNTAYKLTLGKGTLELIDSENKNEKTQNNEINIYFKTGEEKTKEKGSFRTIAYSSSDSSENDLINIMETKLEKDGNIYIEFANNLLEGKDRKISWDKSLGKNQEIANLRALRYFKLYKLPKANNQEYDDKGILYDQEFIYDRLGNRYPVDAKEEVRIKSVEIIGDRTIKIEPKYDLMELNQYEIRMTKQDLIKDNYGEILSINDPLIRGRKFWTKKGNNIKNINWDMETLEIEETIEGKKLPSDGNTGLSFELHGVPSYGLNKPIVLYMDSSEIIPNPKELTPLRKIKLLEGENELDSYFYMYKIEYLKINDIMKTKISFFPKKDLDFGRKYYLIIPEKTFIDRSGNEVGKFEAKFVVEGDGKPGTSREIEEIEWKLPGEGPVDRIEEGIFMRTDFEKDKENISFKLKGYNFAEDIKQVRFVRKSDNKVITIPKKDLNFESVNEISGEINEPIKKELNKLDISSSTVDKNGLVKSSLGKYKVYVDFNRGETASTSKNHDFDIVDRPIVIGSTPRDGEKYVQPKYLMEKFSTDNEEIIYLRLEFNSELGALELGKDKMPLGMSVKTKTGIINIVDEEKELKLKGSTLYIPLKAGLEDNQEYVFTMEEKEYIRYKAYGERFELAVYPYSFSFKTNVLPIGKRIFEGTVPEDYDSDYPLVIEGDNFNSNIEVKFIKNNGDVFYADDVQIRDNDAGGQRLYVYLPDRRRDRLEVGLYDIVLKNGNEYDEELKHGVLSVVKAGEHIPHDQYRIIEDSSLGLVMEMKEVSETKIDMDSRYSNDGSVRLNLDEIMGENTWTRSIEYSPRSSDRIGSMELNSRWTNIYLRNLSLDYDWTDRLIKLRVGRATPFMEASIRNNLYGRALKSDIIEIAGENFSFSAAEIEIPYRESDGYGLQMLRFDEVTGDLIQIPSEVDRINQVVRGISDSSGIFLIVE